MVTRNNGRNSGSKKRLVLSLGSNEGNREYYLNQGIQKLNLYLGAEQDFIRSEVYETEPWGNKNQNSFLNQVLLLESPVRETREILRICLEIEQELGRYRLEKWGPRTIDIDILFFENEIVNEKDLVIPHPEIANRRFILAPLVSLMPDFVHPILNKSMNQLYEECKDALSVKIYSLEHFVNHKN